MNGPEIGKQGVQRSEIGGSFSQKLDGQNWIGQTGWPKVKIGRSFRDKIDGSPEDLQLKVGGLDFLFTARKTFNFLLRFFTDTAFLNIIYDNLSYDIHEYSIIILSFQIQIKSKNGPYMRFTNRIVS